MSRRVAIGLVVLFAYAATSTGALGHSSGDLVGSVNGNTAQKGGKISPTFNVTRRVLFNASGTFRCSTKGSKSYQFYSNGLARNNEPTFRFGRAFTFKLKQKWYASGQNLFKPLRYQKGRVSVTITGTIKQLKAARHSARGSGQVSGHGSVTFKAPGCSSGKLSWSGKGPLNYF